MGRDASIARGNVWYEARLRAAKWVDKLSSRAGAAEMLGVSEEVVKSTEMGLYRHMPVETAVKMADVYNAPELLNTYCMYECPIGCNRAISDEPIEVDRATVKLTQILRKETVQAFKHKLQDIAMDGVISDDELDEFNDVVDSLKDVSKIISQLEIIRDRRMAGRVK